MRIGKLWPLAAGLALILSFVSLERAPPVRASFTLTGTVDCGRASGQACALDGTITIISKDSGAPVKYTIDIGWLKDLPSLDQDDYVSIDIEKIGQILMAQKLTDISGQPGTGNSGMGSSRTTTTTKNDVVGECAGSTATQSIATEIVTVTTRTTTVVVSFGDERTAERTTLTIESTITVSTMLVTPTSLRCGEGLVTVTSTTETGPT